MGVVVFQPAVSLLSGFRFANEMAVGYVVFSSLAIVGHQAKPTVGEVADFLGMTVVVWPSPLVPALQTRGSPGTRSWLFFLGGLFIAVAAVWAMGYPIIE